MGESGVAALVAPLRAAVDELLSVDLTALASLEVTELLRGVEVQRRRLAAVDHRVLSEIDQRGLAGDYARSSTTDLLIDMLRLSPAEARARVSMARDLQPIRMLTGEVVAPVLPRCAQAVTAGEISPAHVAVISKAVDRIPSGVAYEAAPVAEQLLVEAARHQQPGAVAHTASMLLARLDPDGQAPREAELQRRRAFTLTRGDGGMGRPAGEWTPELTATWQAILDALSAPLPAADGLRDDRSPSQRRHDAMLEAGRRLLRSGELPAAGGSPVTVLLRVDAANLTDPTGIAVDGRGEPWPMSRANDALPDATVVPIVFDHHGAALTCGRSKRLATPAQRLALAARDGGCCFPGCTRPAAWCEAHHVIEWLAGGPTDLDNLCLLCSFHHREFARRGWTVRMSDGRPEWLPPPFIDLDQRPIRNTAHHPPDIDFDVGLAS